MGLNDLFRRISFEIVKKNILERIFANYIKLVQTKNRLSIK